MTAVLLNNFQRYLEDWALQIPGESGMMTIFLSFVRKINNIASSVMLMEWYILCPQQD